MLIFRFLDIRPLSLLPLLSDWQLLKIILGGGAIISLSSLEEWLVLRSRKLPGLLNLISMVAWEYSCGGSRAITEMRLLLSHSWCFGVLPSRSIDSFSLGS